MLAAWLLSGALIPVAAIAGPPPASCGGPEGEPVWVLRVIEGDELMLVDGRRVRLAAVEAPRAGLARGGGEDGRTAARLASEARTALAEAVEGRAITLEEIGSDRHGRVLGHLYDIESGQWIEAGLVRAGHLRVVPSAQARVCAASLLREEAEARQARRGLWATSAFAVRAVDTADLAARVGEWVVVEGRVRSVGHSGRTTWLNFGTDFRRDFAVVMNDNEIERFRAAGFEARAARGQTLRVRGVVYHREGPRIAVEVPEDIERVTR